MGTFSQRNVDIYDPDDGTWAVSEDGTATLANEGKQYVSIKHIPTGRKVAFKAMMTEFSDTFASEWNSENAYGRMDPIQTFQRTGRTISLAFDVAATGPRDGTENLARVELLSQFLYPTYDAAGLIKSSPFCEIQFMNWASNSTYWAGTMPLLGTIGGFTFSPNLDMGVFPFKPKKKGHMIIPKVLNISFSFVVIHTHRVGWNKENNFEAADFPYGVSTRFAGGNNPTKFSNRSTKLSTARGAGGEAKAQALAAAITSQNAAANKAADDARRARIKQENENLGKNWAEYRAGTLDSKEVLLPPKQAHGIAEQTRKKHERMNQAVNEASNRIDKTIVTRVDYDARAVKKGLASTRRGRLSTTAATTREDFAKSQGANFSDSNLVGGKKIIDQTTGVG